MQWTGRWAVKVGRGSFGNDGKRVIAVRRGFAKLHILLFTRKSVLLFIVKNSERKPHEGRISLPQTCPQIRIFSWATISQWPGAVDGKVGRGSFF